MKPPDSAPEIGQTLEVTAERLAFGGFCVARHDGLALFVPYAAPGDRLRVEVTRVEKRHAWTRVVEVLEPGPARRPPRCRHFGECGGCQLQHIDYAAQVAAKREFVRDALVRVGGFDWPDPVTVHAAGEWGYRARTQLKVFKRQVGFHKPFTKDVLQVEECPVLAAPLEQGLPAIRAALQQLPRGARVHQVEGACGVDGAAWAPDLPGLQKDLVEHRVLGFSYFVEPEGFFQGNGLLVEQLVRGATSGLDGAVAYDLYAGVGLFTLPLSRTFERVTAVEDERRAATLGRVNVKLNGVTNVTYLRQTTEQFLQACQSPGDHPRPDVVLMDPPRLGAARAIPGLLRLRPERLVYVSCDPNTLARDLRALVDGGYRVDTVEGYDMFPQTYHVECVARLCLDGGGSGAAR